MHSSAISNNNSLQFISIEIAFMLLFFPFSHYYFTNRNALAFLKDVMLVAFIFIVSLKFMYDDIFIVLVALYSTLHLRFFSYVFVSLLACSYESGSDSMESF